MDNYTFSAFLRKQQDDYGNQIIWTVQGLKAAIHFFFNE